jgi:chromosomal replication initiator protein
MRTTLSTDTSQWPELWQAVVRILEQTIVPNQIQAWIHPLRLLDSVSDGQTLRVRIGAPNDFTANWVRDYYKKTFESAFEQTVGTPCEISVVVDETAVQADPDAYAPATVEVARPAPAVAEPVPTGIASGVVLTSGSRASGNEMLEPRYTFDSFVVGASNQFAHASAVAVAEHPAKQYNPLFLYSPPGLGKTHLLHAIGNHMLANKPGARLAYLSAERFVNELIESLQHRRMPQFRTKYRDSFDMILIDDIQFIAGKNTSEEEFFHTFNALHSSKRQIVVTSDRPPKEIQGLEERIRTRFEWGLIADITPPEIETRIAILKTKAERDDIYLTDEVATFLATHIKSNVRELEGVLIRLAAQAALTGAEISLEMAKTELKASIPEEGSMLTIEAIQGAVAKHFRLKVQDLKSTTRARTVALPRQIAMYLIRKYTRVGFKEIGLCFGGKDHTTILHACSKIEKGLEDDSQIRDSVEAIQNLL